MVHLHLEFHVLEGASPPVFCKTKREGEGQMAEEFTVCVLEVPAHFHQSLP